MSQKSLRLKDKYISFSFGKNWKDFLKTLTREQIDYARKSLIDFLGDNVKEKSFIDIGCGSGIFSYAMYSLGAKEIVSFDVDPFSVECTKILREKCINHYKWKIYHGSILDKEFISSLGKFDIVYSWGVLHHSGRMWDAIRNATLLLKENGIFLFAIYNKTKYSKIWLYIKKLYNLLPRFTKRLLDYLLFSINYLFIPILKLNNPVKKVRDYKKSRGMNPIVDVKDWLGGYPYEYASFNEILNYIRSINPNLKLIKFMKTDREANNTFLFENQKYSK